MKIFASEKSIEQLILSNVIVNSYINCSICDKPKTEAYLKSLELIRKSGINVPKAVFALAENDHPDLMYGSAILASTIMNQNDDVFLPKETWSSKNTAINTPFDEAHQNGTRGDGKEAKIIGHIIDCRPIDEDGDIVVSDEVPEYFDLEVDWVVYSSIFPDIAKEIETGAKNNTKFVSMEAKMNDFGYALIKDNEIKIVNRTEETSFLTKYLRIYGGTGTYGDYRIGRVLKDFRFIGMGNVDNPANPKSVYTSIRGKKINEISENNILSCINKLRETSKFVMSEVSHQTKGIAMSKTFETLEEAVKHIEVLSKQIDEMRQAESQKQVESFKSQIESLTTKVKELEDQKTVSDAKISAEGQAKKELQDKFDKLQKEFDQIKSDFDKKSVELSAINAAKKGIERVKELKSLGYKIDDEAVAAEKYAKMSDETYVSVKETIQEALKSITPTDPEGKAKKELETAAEKKEANLPSGDSEEDPVATLASIIGKHNEASKKAKPVKK